MISDVVALAAEMVRMDTSGGEGAVEALRWVDAWFAEAGVGRREFRASGPHAALLVLPEESVPERPVQDLLLFSGHIDVVPAGDFWTTPAFIGDVVSGRLRGRGASDMKGGLAAAMIAVREGLNAGARVGLLVTTSEEIGCQGAEQIVDELGDLDIGAVVIAESTDNAIAFGHRGALWLTITTQGTAAHGASPERGRSAISEMVDVLARIPEIPGACDDLLGAATVNIGTIAGGTAVNVVPARCVVSADHRIVGDAKPIVDWWRSHPEVARVHVDLELPSVRTDRHNQTIRLFDGLAAFSDRPVPYFTDGSVLTRCKPRAPIVIWGPGDPRRVHTADEYVDVEALRAAENGFSALIERWMGRSPDQGR